MKRRRPLSIGGIISLILCLPAVGEAAAWGPVLQCLRAHSVWITWESDREGIGVVRYEAAGGGALEVREEAAGTVHRLRLGDLQADTRHTYTCLVEGTALELHGSFTTASTSQDQSVTFLACSDTGEPPGQTTGSTELLLGQIEARRPAFVLHSGDFTQRGQYLDTFLLPWARVLGEAMVYTAVGNHDIMRMGPQEYADYMITRDSNPGDNQELYYAFDWGPVHVISLDTMSFNQAPAFLAEQEAFVREEYETSKDRPWRLLITHCPPYSRAAMHAREVDNVEPFLTSLCERYSIDVAFCGHVHAYLRSLPIRCGQTGLTPHGQGYYLDPLAPIYLVTAGGREVYHFHPNRNASWMTRSAEIWTYAVVSATARTLTVEVFRLEDSRLFDSFTVEKTFPERESTPPVITNVEVKRCGTSKAVVVWDTDERTEGAVTCYYEGGTGQWKGSDCHYETRHETEVSFSVLEPDARFDIECRDVFGNQTLSAGLTFPGELMFIRGDINMDGAVNVGDPLAALYLAIGGTASGIPCLGAGDVNLDGRFEVADCIYIFNYLFGGGPPPGPPFPDPGPASAEERVSCPGGFYAVSATLPWW